MSAESRSFVHRQLVQFVDTDMAGIVHFSNFFRYMEAAEDAFLRTVGVPLVHSDQGSHASLPRLSARCDFRSPARYGDTLEVAVVVRELREKTIRYAFEFSTLGRRVAEGEVLAIYCEMADQQLRSVPLPESFRRALEPYLVPPQREEKEG
jgi:YbgC/YbaW family acyl-CoA thioester hydrolase